MPLPNSPARDRKPHFPPHDRCTTSPMSKTTSSRSTATPSMLSKSTATHRIRAYSFLSSAIGNPISNALSPPNRVSRQKPYLYLHRPHSAVFYERAPKQGKRPHTAPHPRKRRISRASSAPHITTATVSASSSPTAYTSAIPHLSKTNDYPGSLSLVNSDAIGPLVTSGRYPVAGSEFPHTGLPYCSGGARAIGPSMVISGFCPQP